MFVTKTININSKTIVNSVSLEDLVRLRNREYFLYSHSHDIQILIVLKKLSEYLQKHPETNLYKLTLCDLIYKVRSCCENTINKPTDVLWKEFIKFLSKIDINLPSNRYLWNDYFVLFYTDKAIEKIEMELAE